MSPTNSDPSHFSRDSLSKLKKAVFDIRPVLGRTYEQYGDLSLLEFTKRQYENLTGEFIPQERKNDVISVIQDHVEKILGSTLATSVANQLRTQYAVITADHHGPISHPDVLNSNLLNSFTLLNFPKERIENIIVLSCSSISFDNFSLPRGFLVHNYVANEIVLNKLLFFSKQVRFAPVYNYPVYNEASIKNIKNRLEDWSQEYIIDNQQKERINTLIDEIYNNSSVMALQTYSDQVTKTNYELWGKLFASYSSKPNLIYLDFESIVNTLLLKFHLYKNTLINHLIFDDIYHNLMLKYFNGITAAFSVDTFLGTYLFWALPKNNKHRLSLWKKGNRLVSRDESYSIELTPENVERALREKELIPSTLLSFITLGFYYGLCLVGGGGQTTYYTKMKKAYIAMQEEYGDKESAQFAENIPTDRLSFPYPSIAFLSAGSEIVPSTTLDLFLYGNPSSLSLIKEMAQIITLEQGLLRELPGLYRMLVEKEDQDEKLLALSQKDIDSYTGFEKQIKPYALIKNALNI